MNLTAFKHKLTRANLELTKSVVSIVCFKFRRKCKH